MNKGSIKVAAIAVAMLLATQNNFAKAQDVGSFDALTNEIKNATAVVDLTQSITWNSDSGFKQGTNGISSDITINGNNFTISSNGSYHIGFDAATGTTLTINNASFDNFYSGNWGGALYNAGNLTLENVNFSNNSANNASVGGSAIANAEGGNAKLDGVFNFVENNAARDGGAIYNSSTMAITSSETKFIKNSSKYAGGGAIWNGQRTTDDIGDLTMTGKFDFEENSSGGKGGAIYNSGKISISNDGTVSTVFNSNSSTGGSAIASEQGGEVSLDGNYVFSNNTSSYSGGGAIYNSASMQINSVGITSFTGNKSTSNSGGAIWNGVDYKFGSGDLKLSGQFNFEDNSANNGGGAIFNAADMTITNNNLVETVFKNNSTTHSAGGAIYNKGTLSLTGDYRFENNSALNVSGGAIYNEGAMSLAGTYDFVGNSAKTAGGAIANNSGNLTINGTRANLSSIASVLFHDNSTSSMGGAIHIIGKADNIAFLNVNSADFINNSTFEKGGAIFIDDYANFNIYDSHFVGNSVNYSSADPNARTHGWGGAIGLASTNSDDVRGFIKDSVFLNNYSSDSGGAIPSGTVLTIVNSVFQGNSAKCSGGAVSYDPKNERKDKAFNLIANGGDTIFAGNSVTGGGSTGVTASQEGLYFGNSIVGSDGKAITGDDGNDSNIYFNAGNSGRIIFNDIVDASGTSYDDLYEKRSGSKPKVNNNNIQLNKSDIYYSEMKNETSSSNNSGYRAPDDGTIIFNNTVKGANLVLHNGTLAFGQKITDTRDIFNADGNVLETIDYSKGYVIPEHYFENVRDNVSDIDNIAKITLRGGTLDLSNNHIETGDLFNPDSINVIGSANLRFDMNLSAGDGAIDYIDSVIKDETNGSGSLVIDKILFNSDVDSGTGLGAEKKFQFVRENLLGENQITLADDLKTVITSKAGYSLDLVKTNTSSTASDSIKVTKIASAGGLPVAVSIGQDVQFSGEKTYVYNATEDEKISTWTGGYKVLIDGKIEDKSTSNVLQGELLQINGNAKNVIATDTSVVGIAVGTIVNSEGTKYQKLIVNDVYGTDADGNIQGWKGFNSAIMNDGGVVSLNNSVFSNNASSDGSYTDIDNVRHNKSANGGAILNNSGKINVKNTSFYNNSATNGKGGAIYNAGTAEISATDGNTVEFTGNTASEGNDIYNVGKLNLIATDKSSIIFNGGISGDASLSGSISIGTSDSLGTVIFNNTVANQNISLNTGTLKIGAIADNKAFNNVNLALNGGTLDLQNGQIDTIDIDKLTIGSGNPQLLLDVNLDSDKSDNLSVSSSVTNNGTLYIGPIKILQSMTGNKTKSEVKFINTDKDVITAAIEDVNSFITVNGITYAISLKDNNTLLIEQAGKSGGFAYEVINTAIASRTYDVTENENVETWIGGDSNLAGMRFQIVGNGKSIYTENGLAGIKVGTFEGNAQQLDINNILSYKGFNSAVINDGGKVIVNGTIFEENNSTSNGGAIQNISGNVEINGGSSFLNNIAVGNGGAIYNGANGILTLRTDSGKDILFSGNTATSGKDIYNDNGSINMQGTGKVELNGGVAGTGSIASSANLILKSDNSRYTGTFEQTTRKDSDGNALESGSTTVESGASFFGGESHINAGSLIWNTANDISEKAKLTINNGDLTIGNVGQLTINSGSSVAGASSITTNGNLTLNNNAETVVKKLDGTGSITINGGSGLTINNSSTVGSFVKITSNGQSDNFANLNVIGAADSILNADSTIKAINNPNFMHLTLDNTSVETADLNLTTDGLAKVTTKNTVTIKDGATLALSGSSTLENDGDLTIERAGELSDNSTIRNNKTLTLQGNGKLTSSSADSTIYNTTDAILNVKADQSGFKGKFENHGTTNVDDSSMLFGGEKLISAGQMIINAGTVTGDNYKNIQLSNGGSLTQYITDTDTVGKIDDTVFSFNGSGNSVNFITNGNTKGKLELNSNIENGQQNTISFKKDEVSLSGTTDFTGGTIYNFEDSNINLNLDADGNTQDYNFSNITGSNNKLSFNIKIEDVAGATDGSKYIKTDTLTISGGDGSQKFDIGELYLTGKENGWNGTYNTNDGNVLTGASFNDITDGKITLATTSWVYDVTKNGDNTIQMTINKYASNNTLYEMNATDGTRFFQFSDDGTNKEQTYNIGQSLSETKNGTFTVSGYDKDKCTISGNII